MTQEFHPTSEQIFTIARSLEFIQDELRDLKQEIDCPNSYIVHLMKEIICTYKVEEKT